MKRQDLSPGTVGVLNAALDARDLLRGRIVPAVERLTLLVADVPGAGAILADIRGCAGHAADQLRFAVKNRRGGPRS
jgi:hypothetical protein